MNDFLKRENVGVMVKSWKNVVSINIRIITTHIHYLFELIRSYFTSLNTQRCIIGVLPQYIGIRNSIILDNWVTRRSLLIQRRISVGLPEYIKIRNLMIVDNCVKICFSSCKISFSYVYSAANKDWVYTYNLCKDELFRNLSIN